MGGVHSNKIQREQLKKGDHIYSWRLYYIYAHHGIYVGDGKVIHFTRAARQESGRRSVFDRVIFSSAPISPGFHCPSCGDQSKLGGVICSCLDCFLSGGDIYLYEYGVSMATFVDETRGGACTLALAEPEEKVVHRAKFLLANGFGAYDLFRNNCIDFAIYCKTSLRVDAKFSLRRCGQVASLLADAKKFIASKGYMLRFLARRCPYLIDVIDGLYAGSKWFSDIEVRPDATRIAVEYLASGKPN